MKSIIFFFVFSMFTGVVYSQKEKNVEILPQSQISITGDVKVSTFTCEFQMENLKSPDAVVYTKTSSGINFKNAELILNNRGFDCGSSSQNEDFHEMVQTEEHSQMKLILKEISRANEDSVQATASILIAGEENIYKIPVEINERAEGSEFKGTFKINIRDFGLEPIKKMFGLIVVQDIIDVDLHLVVRYL